MLVFLIFAVFGLFSRNFVFAPLFLSLIIALCYRRLLVAGIIALGLLYDLFWVWPLGCSSFFLSLFILVIYVYGQKYSYYNQFFLFVLLCFGSLIVLSLNGQKLTVGNFFIFSLMYLFLSLRLRSVRQKMFRRI